MYNILISKITNGEEHFKVSVCLMEYLDGVYFQYFQNHKKIAILYLQISSKILCHNFWQHWKLISG